MASTMTFWSAPALARSVEQEAHLSLSVSHAGVDGGDTSPGQGRCPQRFAPGG